MLVGYLARGVALFWIFKDAFENLEQKETVIAEYQERADYFIRSGRQSPAVLERWALKIQGLEERKRHYEQVLRRELDGLDDEFSTLKFMGQELQNRAKNIRFQKAAIYNENTVMK
nr:DUF6744 family protein [uncultured Oscillibacter sp.]